MRQVRLWMFLTPLLAAGVALGVACGGDDAPTLTEYMTRMDDIDKDVDTRFETLFEDQDAGARDIATGAKEAVAYAREQHEGVEPADEAKDAHEELVAALVELEEGMDPGSFAEDAPADEFFETFETTRVDDAFCAIQEIADENNIEADVGCEGGGEAIDPSTIDPVEATAVEIQDFAFGPPHIQVAAGDTVTWTQGSDGAPHNVISSDDPAVFESENLEDEGAEFEHTFDEAGVFPYFCSIHPEMLGQVTVEE